MFLAVAAAALVCTAAPSTLAQAAGGVPGVDVSNWTGEVDWSKVTDGGGAFAFVLATEGVDFKNQFYDSQYGGAAAAGLLRGTYHFAQPHETDGATQADYYVNNGGDWKSDGWTLPGALDIEDNPYNNRNGKNSCYDLNQADMVTWIKDFTQRYRQRTGRDAIIYTTTSWWRTCTGDSAAFAANPLWLAKWGTDPGELPKSWKKYTFWQSADKGEMVGGTNAFNGSRSQLEEMANPPAKVTVSGQVKGTTLYSVTISNTGMRPVTDVALTGRTFGGMRVVKVTTGCKFSGTAVRCKLAELPPGQKATFSFATKVGKKAGQIGMRFAVGSVNLTIKPR